jgi:ribonuclease VapC
MIIEEPGHERLLDATADVTEVAIGAPTLVETDMVVISRFGLPGRALVAQFLERNSVIVIAFDEVHRHVAAEAFIRYGKGQNPAGLNYGDCMTYATAHVADHPLLFTGSDFSKTDIPSALA